MLAYAKRDITTITKGVIAHGVNCQHAMGSGIAKAIRSKWPQVYTQFRSRPKGKQMLGTADPVYLDGTLIVVNCYTQEYYGRDGYKYADEQAVALSILKAAEVANLQGLNLYLPRIGCGLGGLNWESDVEPAVERAAERFPLIDIFVCDLSGEGNASKPTRS